MCLFLVQMTAIEGFQDTELQEGSYLLNNHLNQMI